MPTEESTRQQFQLFYSYAHKDEEFRNELEVHLSVLQRQGIIGGWHDRRLVAGTEWSKEISRNLEVAHIILLLISPDFIASEYCYDIELNRAMERHEAGDARIIPVIIRGVDNWTALPFGKLQAVPKDARPVKNWADRDEAWVDVARNIRLACKELQEIFNVRKELLAVQNISPETVETKTESFNPNPGQIKLSGKTIKLVNPSAETVAQIGRIREISMDVQHGDAAGILGNSLPEDRLGAQRNIDEVLTVMDETGERRGRSVEELHAGDVHISRVDLLYKKAILLQAVAEEENLAVQTPDEESKAAHRAKLKASFELLQQANKLDPTNTEVLLQMAQLLVVLTPNDPSDEHKLLKLIRRLLGEPESDVENFRLARATFMMAMTSQPPNIHLLSEARAIFERLGRAEWVNQCDSMLPPANEYEPGTAQKSEWKDLYEGVKDMGKSLKVFFVKPKPQAAAATPPPVANQPRAEEVTPPAPQPPREERYVHPPQQATPPPPPPQQPQTLQFAGHWQLHVIDTARTIINVNFIPNGVCFGSIPRMGNAQFQGRWGFNSYNRTLQLQGLINNQKSFMVNIIIHGPRDQGLYGVGLDGYGYMLVPQGK